MSVTYINEGDILIPTPFGTALPASIIHATNGNREYVEVERYYWRKAWRVVDARPGCLVLLPLSGPQRRMNVR
jgi:hypothetical protein